MGSWLRYGWAGALVVGTLAACSSSTIKPPIDTQGGKEGIPPGSEEDGGGDAGSACVPTTGGACNDLANCSNEIKPTLGSGAAPTSVGGTVTAGTYVLSSITLYGNTSGGTGGVYQTETFTLSVASDGGIPEGGATDAGESDAQVADAGTPDSGASGVTMTWNDVTTSNSNTTPDTVSGNITFTGAQMQFTYACGTGALATHPVTYTATPTTITENILTGPGTNQVNVFTLF